MKLGIVGLPNVGKSTLFNAITKAGIQAANYPFCTIEPNIGLVNVPDKRLEVLTDINKSKKTVPATIEFYDIAGLVRGASKGEGLGNQFLADIRECEAIVEVLRCFDDDNVIHVDGSVDAIRDIETIHLELIFSDIDLLTKVREKRAKASKGDKSILKEVELIDKILEVLNEGKSARVLQLNDEEKNLLKSYQLLSLKPIIFVANVSETDFVDGAKNNKYVSEVKEFANDENAKIVLVSANMEAELSTLSDIEKKEYLDMLGVDKSGIDNLIIASYDLLGLMSFLTTGEDETRAWTIKKGTSAVNAAAKIHTDISRGFIRAEIVSYNDLVKYGSYNALREKGLVRLEGKEYIMQDGDIVHFRFNV